MHILDEMHELNTYTDELKAMADQVVAIAEQAINEETLQLNRSEESIRQVITRFKGIVERLKESSIALQTEAASVRRDIEKVLVELQFQDRVNQILTLVSRNLKELESRIFVRFSPNSLSDGMDPLATLRYLQTLGTIVRDGYGITSRFRF